MLVILIVLVLLAVLVILAISVTMLVILTVSVILVAYFTLISGLAYVTRLVTIHSQTTLEYQYAIASHPIDWSGALANASSRYKLNDDWSGFYISVPNPKLSIAVSHYLPSYPSPATPLHESVLPECS